MAKKFTKNMLGPFPAPVAFARSRNPKDLPEHVQLLIVPSSSSWNDFNLRLHADFGARSSVEDFKWTHGFLAFKEQQSTPEYLSKIIPKERDFIVVHDVKDSYATMLSSVEGYQMFADVYGFQRGDDIARMSSNDIAVLISHGQAISGWEDFEVSAAFNESFMRNAEAAFAFKNGPMVLRGQYSLANDDARTAFLARVTFGKSEIILNFDFSKSGVIDDRRMAVLIGGNGTGKTATLAAISKALESGNDPAVSTISPMPAFNRLAVFVHSRALQAFGEPSERRNGDPRQGVFSLDPQADGSELHFTPQILSMLRGAERMGDPIRRLNGILSKHFPDVTIAVPILSGGRSHSFALDDGSWAPLRTFPISANEQRVLQDSGLIDVDRPLVVVDRNLERRSLSLGQRSFLAFAIQAIHSALPASIILIDEPENFLHPSLLSQFVRLLADILKDTKSIAIVATHSPFVVREVHQSQVHVLARDDVGGLVVTKPRMKTLGANVGDISSDIFGDDMTEHLFQERIRSVVGGSSDIRPLLELLKDELSLESLMRLRALLSSDGNDAFVEAPTEDF